MQLPAPMLGSVVATKAQRKKLCQRRVAVRSLVRVYQSQLLGLRGRLSSVRKVPREPSCVVGKGWSCGLV